MEYQSTNLTRVKKLSEKEYQKGPFIYWMSRDQRVHDNWALLYTQKLAQEHHVPFAVVFSLRKTFAYATSRMLEFMLEGLTEVEKTLRENNIPFYFLPGDPETQLRSFVKKYNVGGVVTDFSPLRYNRKWKDTLSKSLAIPFYEVDAHNIVPVWVASGKQEFGAYTLRPKIQRLLADYLIQFPMVKKQALVWKEEKSLSNWGQIRKQINVDTSVPPVKWITPGETAAEKAMEDFFEMRLDRYDTERNDPTLQVQSNLSPYIHFGHISTQRIALEIDRIHVSPASKKAFLEELIIRKELSDNFCYYNNNYDNPNGFPEWAKKTIESHKNDKREFIYSLIELKNAKTHDRLWNAAQKEMVKKGKMHGYMRMYWAKKIYEWSNSAEEAMKHAVYLNDTYFLDGRDPNGYTGIAWSIGGVHDRAWFEREIFGKLRFMSFNGAKSKFSIDEYIDYVARLE